MSGIRNLSRCLGYPRITSLLRRIKAVTTLIPVTVEDYTELKSYVKGNPGSAFIISFIYLLIGSAISIAQGHRVFANELAAYAYYSLVCGIALQIISFLTRRAKKFEQTEQIPTSYSAQTLQRG